MLEKVNNWYTVEFSNRTQLLYFREKIEELYPDVKKKRTIAPYGLGEYYWFQKKDLKQSEIDEINKLIISIENNLNCLSKDQ